MARVAVSPQVLQWALDRASRDRVEIQQRFPKLPAWISGDEQPTLRQLEDFAKATATPFGYLFLKVPPPPETISIPNYRTIDDRTVRRPSPELIDTLHAMELRQAWLRDYLIDEARDPLPIVRCAKQSDDPIRVAARLRELLKLEPTWASRQSNWTNALRTLRDEMGRAGIVVVFNSIVGNNTSRALNVEEFRGFVLIDEYAPVVFVNSADSKSAQMFTLAHELAHVAFGVSAAFDLREMQPASAAVEQACNRVAAEFLVPAAELRRVWDRQPSDPFEAVARYFKVSQIVAARRLLDLGLISRDEFFDFYRRYTSEERREKEQTKNGPDFHTVSPQRVGARFAVELARALKQGKILHLEAYRLTGLQGNAFSELSRRAMEGALL